MTALPGRLRGLLAGERQMFVLVNVGVNLLFLARSYATMQVLDHRQLGLAVLLQSVMLLIGALHFGVINGGYRLICAASEEEAVRLNDFVFSVIGVVAAGGLVVVAVILPFVGSGSDTDLVMLLGVGGGAFALARTWIMNRMIARSMLRTVNRINFWSAAGSLLAFFYAGVNPLLACLSAIVLQPCLFVLVALCFDRTMVPRRFEANRRVARDVMHAGFVVFLTGIFLQLNMQIERWYVTGYLGLEALGHLYLAILFVTLFQLVPTSIDQVYLPTIVRENAADTDGLPRVMRQYFSITAAYCGLAMVTLAAIARPLTALILPEYVADLRYVYLMAPGLLLLSLANPFAIMFNVLIKYRTFFIAYGFGTAITCGLIGGAIWAGKVLSLEAVVLIRTGVYALMAAMLMVGFVTLSRKHPRFRFRLGWA